MNASKHDEQVKFWSTQLEMGLITKDQHDQIVSSLAQVASENKAVWGESEIKQFGFKPKPKGKASYKGYEFFSMPIDARKKAAFMGKLLVFECYFDKKFACKVACDVNFNGLWYFIDENTAIYVGGKLFTRKNPNDYIDQPLNDDKYLACYQCLYDIMLGFRNNDKKYTERSFKNPIDGKPIILKAETKAETAKPETKPETGKKGKK